MNFKRFDPAVLALAAVLFAVLMAFAGRYGIFRDEMYYAACGEHLSFGYVDHPPLVAFMARFERTVLGDSLYALRFLPALLAAATVVVTAELARTLGGSRYAQILAATCVCVAPDFLGTFHILSMNSVLPLAWTVCALCAVRALLHGEERFWIGFGVAAGLGLLAKHSTLFFGAALTLGMLATHSRAFARRGPWIALAIALSLFAPNLAWEQLHGWPTLEFMHNAQTKKMVNMSPLEFTNAMVLEMLPLTAPVWVAGAAWLLAVKRFRFLGIAFVTVSAIIVIGHGKPYYLAPAFPIAFAAGAVAIESWVANRAARAVSVGVVAAGGVALAPFALPVLDPPAYVRYAATLGIQPAAAEKHVAGPLPQFMADQHGWEAMATKIADAYGRLAPEEQAVAAIFTNNYGEAGAIDYFGPRWGLPRASSGHNAYFMWGPPAGRGAVLIAIGPSKEELLAVYEQVDEVAVTDDAYAMPYEHRSIYVARRPRESLQAIWPRTKMYI